MSKVTQDQIEELYLFLQGKCPDTMRTKPMPRLSPNAAFSVIYYLQERLGILPDNYEQCRGCKCIIDADYEGVFFDSFPTSADNDKEQDDGKPIPKSWEGHWCDDCAPCDWRYKE